MPKTIYFGSDDSSSRQGIDITYIKGRKVLIVSGWYDSFVGMGDTEISLLDFCKRLAISKRDLEKVIESL